MEISQYRTVQMSNHLKRIKLKNAGWENGCYRSLENWFWERERERKNERESRREGERERKKEKKEGKYLNKYLLVFCPAPGIGHPSHIASLPCICKVLSEGVCAYEISGENIDCSLWSWFQSLDWFSLNTLSLKDIQPFILKWHLKKIILPYINLVKTVISATVYAYSAYWTGSISYMK